MKSLFFLLSILFLCTCNAATKTLVLLENNNIQQTHSIFFKSLAARGHDLTFKNAYDDDNQLDNYGEWLYDNLVLFAPSSEDFGEKLSVETIVKFIDSGRNVLVAGGPNVSEPTRELANECGVDFDEEQSLVIDHLNYDQSDANGPHTLVAVDNWVRNSVLLGKGPSGPVLFRGIGHAAAEGSRLLTKVLTGTPTSYSHNPRKPVQVYPQSAGTDTLLVTAVQTRNNGRVVLSGSLELFGNKFFRANVQTPKSAKPTPSGNEDFAIDISKWAFQERGRLRATKITHHQVGNSVNNPQSYRIKDDIEFSVVLEEYDGSKWVPFTQNDVQLEFVMIDPYVRINLAHNGAGVYSVKFTLPDVYGVFKFVINYHRLGYTNLEIAEQVSVHPFRHNDYERFIFAAYPYYLSAFSMMGGFFVFGVAYLYTRDHGKQHSE